AVTRPTLGTLGGRHPADGAGTPPPEAANRAGRSQPHRRRRRAAAVAWPVRSRPTLLRRDLPQAISLSDREDTATGRGETRQQRRTDCAVDGTNADRPTTRVAVKARSRAAVRRR